MAICAYYCRVSFILDEQIGAVLRLTLNRPEKKNAITQDMYQRLADKINEAAGDFSIRAVVINSNGDSFTAGNDINDFANDPQMDEGSPVFNFLFAIHNFPKPLMSLPAVKESPFEFITTARIEKSPAASFILSANLWYIS